MTLQYDLDLFEQLNAEYRVKPIQPNPIKRDAKTFQERAVARINTILRDVTLAKKRVLDIGCGHGWFTTMLVSHAGVQKAIGVDIQSYPSWEEHTDSKVSLHVADISKDNPIEPGSIDLVVSNAVFEHVSRPLQMLEAIHQVLKPGGQAWLYINMYRGPRASHRYNEVFFPWPHLLFEDDVLSAYYEKHHQMPSHFSWVNKMTIAHYLQACYDIGFQVKKCHRKQFPLDIPFYLRFIDKLEKYPALDLETDFITLILNKKTVLFRKKIHNVGYIATQRKFDAAVETYQQANPPYPIEATQPRVEQNVSPAREPLVLR